MSAARSSAELTAMVQSRVAGRPLEQVLGWAEFCGLRIAVEPGVFVPRQRTEFLVDQAATLARLAADPPGRAAGGRKSLVVVDLCCGSGALGAALAARVDRIELYAVDIDPAPVRCARRNLADLGGRVFEGDLFEPLPAGLRDRIEVLLANTPYVPSEEVRLLPPEARLHEPLVALDGGADGLAVARRVLAAAPGWLAPGGHVLIETSERQAPVLAESVSSNGLLPRVARSDELNATVVIGTRPALPG